MPVQPTSEVGDLGYAGLTPVTQAQGSNHGCNQLTKLVERQNFASWLPRAINSCHGVSLVCPLLVSLSNKGLDLLNPSLPIPCGVLPFLGGSGLKENHGKPEEKLQLLGCPIQ